MSLKITAGQSRGRLRVVVLTILLAVGLMATRLYERGKRVSKFGPIQSALSAEYHHVKMVASGMSGARRPILA